MKIKLSFRFLCAILVCALLVNATTLNAFAASGDVISSIEKTNSTWYGYPEKADIYVASSIAYMGAEWSSSRQAWAFNFRFAGTGSADWRSGGNAAVIRCAGMEIKVINNKNNVDLWTSNSSKYLGSAPESGTHPNYGGVASAVVGLAITALNSLGASYAWSVVSLIAAFVNTTDSSTTQSDRLYRGWDWTSDKADVGQFFWFIVDVKPNKTTKISSDYYLLGPGYELLDAGLAYYNLTASSGRGSQITMNPETMSDAERKACGIETISRQDFIDRASELNISDRSQDEFLNSDDEFFYYAHDFDVSEDTENNYSEPQIDVNKLTRESLIACIEFQIDRSEKIVRGFSGKNIANNAENAEICKKHSDRIIQLNELLAYMDVTDSEGTLDLYSVYMKYNSVLGNDSIVQ